MAFEPEAIGSYAILDLLGHRRLVGYVSEEDHFGSRMGRIDVLGAGGMTIGTQFFSAASVYLCAPCDEATAKLAAESSDPRPLQAYTVRELIDAEVERRLSYIKEDWAAREQRARQREAAPTDDTDTEGLPF